MYYDSRRRVFILQRRSFWTGLALILCLIAIGLELSFKVPTAGGPERVWLVIAILTLFCLVLKINYTILLSIQVELNPETGELLMKSIFNQQDVGATLRSVELNYPKDEGMASLAIVAEKERYELYGWVSSDEANRIYECYARQIARTLRLPLKSMRQGASRQVTQPSALAFRSFLSRENDPSLFRSARERLLKDPNAEVEAPDDQRRLRISWTPSRTVSRFLWGSAGAMICTTVALTLAGLLSYLLTPAGYSTVTGLVTVWIYWGAYIYFAPTELSLEDRQIRYRLANPLARLIFFPFTQTPFSAPVEDLGDAWVAGDESMERLYLEFRRELISIETAPLPAKNLIACLLHQILTKTVSN